MISQSFQERLFPVLPEIAKYFGTPFNIIDEKGVRETCRKVKEAFKGVPGFRNYYAVKALPDPDVLAILREEGFGFDCSSTHELQLSMHVGARGHDMMFTSNNTSAKEFFAAMQAGAVMNLDDVSLIPKIPGAFPELICFRYNPGKLREAGAEGGGFGKPWEAKYGIMDSQVIAAYAEARNRGAEEFGIHTMICSNERDYQYIVETVRMLLGQVDRLERELGIPCKFMNIGGGLGIAYKPGEVDCDVGSLGAATKGLIEDFQQTHGWAPDVLMESGRFITGHHGVLVNRVINRKEIYETHVGVEVAMPALMRPEIYQAYHDIVVLDGNGDRCDDRPTEIVNVVGSICENCDRLATGRELPRTKEGDFIVTANTGAHSWAMGFNYNGRLRPQQLMLREDGTVIRTKRTETDEDLWSPFRGFDRTPLRLSPDEVGV